MSFPRILTIIWSRKWLVVCCLSVTVILTIAVSLLLPKQYIAKTSLVLDQRGIDPITGVMLPAQMLMATSYMATQLDVIASHNVALKVVKSLKLDENQELKELFQDSDGIGEIRDWAADLLLKNLEVKPSRESSILQICFSSVEPEFSALVANAFAEAYIQTTVELKVQPAKLNADWFDSQLSSLRKNLEKSQEKLSALQQLHGIVMADEHLDLEDARLAELTRQLLESQGHTHELMSRKKQLADTLAGRESFESMQEVLNNTFVQTLKSDLARAEGKFAELAERVDKNHPQYLQAKAEISNLRKKIQAEVGTVLNGIASSASASKQRDDSLTATIAEQKRKVLELKKKRDEITVLKREFENAQLAYDTAMQRSVQTRMESEVNQTNIAVLNPAIPPQKPDKPRVLLNVLISLFLGSLLGVGIALLAEILDRRVRSSWDISDRLGMPVFGVIGATQVKGVLS